MTESISKQSEVGAHVTTLDQKSEKIDDAKTKKVPGVHDDTRNQKAIVPDDDTEVAVMKEPLLKETQADIEETCVRQQVEMIKTKQSESNQSEMHGGELDH